MQELFLKNFTDFIFPEDTPEPADVIFVPGNGYPQMAERAAALWREGYAPFVLPSGKYSVTLGHFSGDDMRRIEEACRDGAAAAAVMITEGIETAMNRFNGAARGEGKAEGKA